MLIEAPANGISAPARVYKSAEYGTRFEGGRGLGSSEAGVRCRRSDVLVRLCYTQPSRTKGQKDQYINRRRHLHCPAIIYLT